MVSATNRRWLLARRPEGMIRDEDFRLVEEPVGDLGSGQVLVQVQVLSCDPTQRGWLAADTYMPAVGIGEVVRSVGAGRIVTSRHPDFAEGDMVAGLLGWQDFAVVDPGGTWPLAKLSPGMQLETALGVLGLNGLTAYFGLLDIGRPQAGETVVVSGAAGATGSIVGQIAKVKGCRVIGIAGGSEKCRWLTEVAGLDAAIDYKSENVAERLAALCPNGINVYFDNVGGEILEAALALLARHGRVVLCGAISGYNDLEHMQPPRNYLMLLLREARMEGFLAPSFIHRQQEALEALAGWLSDGRIKHEVDIQHGLENAPATLRRLFEGRNISKQLLRISG
ncbi:NADP-dependent oxidoreductase [Rhodopila globiformis]|uniref:NADP-dependent oxidoreductase n=1 Tax=Rhodopila globiformis TaxID=1071 RepID=A0A2S6N105_RHOGL|nr:NADP-dependent oxidoreductase [Rhodopila globiformis]PPQ28307.1 NADP-dependent oxidoreductase [Rhodopila globiformis]